MARARKVDTNGEGARSADAAVPASLSRNTPLVFISHDHRDADLAEAFGNLLTDASGGVLQSFRSSDRKGTTGIEFGSEWYNAIMSKLGEATDVVALLTQHSLDRPWILYEAGVAKGKLNSTVLGIAVGIDLEKANAGPFAQFQNCGDDVDSLTKLVLQLIKRNPQASPRAEAVRRQVAAFVESAEGIKKSRGSKSKSETPVDQTSVAKIFEEVKVLVRDLPQRLELQIREGVSHRQSRRKRRFHPMMILEEIMHHPSWEDNNSGQTVGLMVVASMLRDDHPWFFELVADLHRSVQLGNRRAIETARNSLMTSVDVLGRRGLFEVGGPKDEEMYFVMHHITEIIERIGRVPRTGGPKRNTEDDADKSS